LNYLPTCNERYDLVKGGSSRKNSGRWSLESVDCRVPENTTAQRLKEGQLTLRPIMPQ